MKILVTGGAGFIGSHLVDRLILDQTREVIVLDNFSRSVVENFSQGESQVRVVRGDIRDSALLQKSMCGVDVVYHLAAQSNVLGAVRDIDYTFETNVIGTYGVLRAATKVGVRRVIFSSSREVYGEPATLPVPETAPLLPKNAYGVSKAAAEMYCRLFSGADLEVVVFRLANVYGPRDRDRVIPLFVKRALSSEPLTIFGNRKILDFLWIDDLIDVLLKSFRSPHSDRPVNLGSGKGINLVDLAERICVLAGRSSNVRVSEERQPEVGRFVADVSIACKLFNLRCPEDPLEHLPLLVESFRDGRETQPTQQGVLNRE